jgi:anaerobic selenocysteine-containing dehydrogenase
MKLTRRGFLKGTATIGAAVGAGAWIRTTADASQPAHAQPAHDHHTLTSSSGSTTTKFTYRGLKVAITEAKTGAEVKVNGRVKRVMLDRQRDGCYWSHLRPFDDDCQNAVSLVKKLIDMAYQGLFVLE